MGGGAASGGVVTCTAVLLSFGRGKLLLGPQYAIAYTPNNSQHLLEGEVLLYGGVAHVQHRCPHSARAPHDRIQSLTHGSQTEAIDVAVDQGEIHQERSVSILCKMTG